MKKTLLLLTLIAACFTLGACSSASKCTHPKGKAAKGDSCCAS
ncbi:MAG: hypothetical protein ABMA01_18165 [Chthoniobacteraceae bacterium]